MGTLSFIMRIIAGIILSFFFIQSYGQFPYVKKLNYPEQLPTQVVYDMLTDSKGYIWLGTNKGLYRFNGRAFVEVPFDSTSSIAVSYLQEDADGKIWCMNFYNQLFSYRNDTLRRFWVDNSIIKDVSTFNNVSVGSKHVWFRSFKSIFEFDKKTHELVKVINAPKPNSQIVASVYHNDQYYAYSNTGFLFSSYRNEKGWTNTEQVHPTLHLINQKEGIVGLSTGLARTQPFEMINGKCIVLPPVELPKEIFVFQGVAIDNNEYWLCTQNGAYKWNKETGETKCYLPNERVSDVVRDYQGNYWFSTLDNGVFICPSLHNTLLKIYNDPLLDNFTKILTLPDGSLMAGNSQGLMTKFDLGTREHFHYDLTRLSEIEFINYDTTANIIFSNRGVFKQNRKEPVELLDYSKGVSRDRFGNLIFAVFNGAYVLNDHVGKMNRLPLINCPLYEKHLADTVVYEGRHSSIILRQKRSLSVLGSANKECFWVGYEDGLYEYYYNGDVKILKDGDGRPVIAKSLQQQSNGNLVVGSSTRGVLVFRDSRMIRSYTEKNGLSSNNIRKVLKEDESIWVLTDEGLDRIDGGDGSITNYLEEYGLSNTIINDFSLDKGKILFATPTGLLERYNLPRYSNFEIKFPLLKATYNGKEIPDGTTLPGNGSDIVFYFEALHYISIPALSFQYRLQGIDSIWRPVGTLNNQLIINRLSPGNYVFEIRATAGPNYKSAVRHFSFTVPNPFWQKKGFIITVILITGILFWLFLRRWKHNLIRRQAIKEQLLKSQLVALRAQMNPHFLYNVLNTVQGLVYGNRKTEAGELLGNFSDLMRKTLQASDKQLLPLKDEIENIRLYLELEKARFDEGFEYHIDVVNIDDLSKIAIPSLLLQPFAENAVKHGLMHKQGAKKLDIRFEQMDEGLSVIIDDNGIGRAQSMEINKRSQGKPFSFATAALTERMNLFNRLYKQKISCEIVDKMDETGKSNGTMIILFIPDYSRDPHAL